MIRCHMFLIKLYKIKRQKLEKSFVINMGKQISFVQLIHNSQKKKKKKMTKKKGETFKTSF